MEAFSDGGLDEFTSGQYESNDFDFLVGYSDQAEEEFQESQFEVYGGELAEENEKQNREEEDKKDDEEIIIVLNEIKDILVGSNADSEITDEKNKEESENGDTDENGSGEEERISEVETSEPTTEGLMYYISQDVKAIREIYEGQVTLQQVSWKDARLYYKLSIGLSSILLGIIVIYIFIGRIR